MDLVRPAVLFHVVKLPPCWRKFMAFDAPVPGHRVGRPREGPVHAASATVAMGWISAAGVSQHIHRNAPCKGRAISAGLPRETECRRDRASPFSALATEVAAREIYTDDLALGERIVGELGRKEAPPGGLRRAARRPHSVDPGTTQRLTASTGSSS